MVKQNETLINALKEINLTGKRATVVINEREEVIGFLTDGDIRRALLNGKSLFDKVSDIYNRDFVWVLKEEATIPVLKKIFIEKKISQIPILDSNRRLVKIVSAEEMLRPKFEEVKSKEQKINRYYSKGRVLIIGGAGYVGSWLAQFLLEDGYYVIVYDTLLFGDDSVKELYDHPNYELIKADITDLESLLRAHSNVDAVVHLAGIVGDPASRLDTKLTITANYVSAATVAAICKYLRIPRMVLASTCSVYGKGEGIFTEESPVNPLSPYAYTKYESENVVLSLSDEFFAPTILRFGTIFGISLRPRFDLVVNLLTAKAVKGEKVFIFGGKQHRPFIHVSDVARAIKLVLEAPIEKVKNQIFNVGDDKLNIELAELKNLIKEVIPNAEIEILKDIEDPRDYVVSFKKIKETLGFEATKTLKDGIIEIKEYLEMHPEINYNSSKYNNKIQLEEVLKPNKK